MERIEKRVVPGEKIKVCSEVNLGRAFPVKVTRYKPGRAITWTGGLPRGLFKGVRTFTLTPGEQGVTRFETVEAYAGPLVQLISRAMPDLGPSFRAVRQRPQAGGRGGG